MILTGPEIHRERDEGRLALDPFDKEHLSTNSYDLTLGRQLLYYTGDVLDTRRPNPYQRVTIPADGFELRPDRIYLGSSVETVGSNHYVPLIHSRSGAARLGLYAHCTADLIDVGSLGQVTFQLRAVQPIRVYAGDRLGQVSFWHTEGEITLYDGKYQGSCGPQPSQIHQDAHASDGG